MSSGSCAQEDGLQDVKCKMRAQFALRNRFFVVCRSERNKQSCWWWWLGDASPAKLPGMCCPGPNQGQGMGDTRSPYQIMADLEFACHSEEECDIYRLSCVPFVLKSSRTDVVQHFSLFLGIPAPGHSGASEPNGHPLTCDVLCCCARHHDSCATLRRGTEYLSA